MTKLLDEAIARIEALPEEEQDRAAEVLMALASEQRPYSFTAAQVAGIELAMQQADKGHFATDKRSRGIFDRDL